MSDEPNNPPPTNTDRAHAMARHGCGCLSMASAVFLVLVFCLSRVT